MPQWPSLRDHNPHRTAAGTGPSTSYPEPEQGQGLLQEERRLERKPHFKARPLATMGKPQLLMREGPQSSLVFSYSLLASDGQFTHQAGTMTLAPLPKEDLKAPTKMVMSLTLSRLLVIARPRSTLHYVLSPPSPPATLCLEVNQGPQAQWAISDHVEPWGLHSMHPTCRGQRPPLL